MQSLVHGLEALSGVYGITVKNAHVDLLIIFICSISILHELLGKGSIKNLILVVEVKLYLMYYLGKSK